MDLKTFKNKLLEDPRFKEEYERVDLAFEIGQIITEVRIIKGITQSKLAEMIGTKQSSIARAESGVSLPSLSFLKKIADAVKARIIFKFEFPESEISVIDYNSVKGSRKEPSGVYISGPSPRSNDPLFISQKTESTFFNVYQ